MLSKIIKSRDLIKVLLLIVKKYINYIKSTTSRIKRIEKLQKKTVEKMKKSINKVNLFKKFSVVILYSVSIFNLDLVLSKAL